MGMPWKAKAHFEGFGDGEAFNIRKNAYGSGGMSMLDVEKPNAPLSLYLAENIAPMVPS